MGCPVLMWTRDDMCKIADVSRDALSDRTIPTVRSAAEMSSMTLGKAFRLAYVI